MTNCKDCLYWEVCNKHKGAFWGHEAQYSSPIINASADSCIFYKDRSRFVEVPCKVGDRVYYIANVNGKDEINSAVVQKVTIHFENEVGYDCGIGEIGFSNHSIGKRVFLTKKQAEQALKEREQRNNTD